MSEILNKISAILNEAPSSDKEIEAVMVDVRKLNKDFRDDFKDAKIKSYKQKEKWIKSALKNPSEKNAEVLKRIKKVFPKQDPIDFMINSVTSTVI